VLIPWRENDFLKKQLTELGYEVPKTEWSRKPPDTEEKRDESQTGAEGGEQHPPSRQSKGPQQHHSSNRPLRNGAGFGQATAHQLRSSSSRKRTHDEYVEEDSEILRDVLLAREPESDNLMLRPKHFYSQGETRNNRVLGSSQSPSQVQKRNNRNEEQSVSRSGPVVQVYANNGWKPQPTSYGQHQHLPSHDGSHYRMSGALPPTVTRNRLETETNYKNIQQSNQSRFDQPQPLPSRTPPILQPFQTPDNLHRQYPPENSRYNERGYALAHVDGRHAVRPGTYNKQIWRTASRASVMRQPLMFPRASKMSNYARDSGYLSNVDLNVNHSSHNHNNFFHPTTPAAQRHTYQPAVRMPQHTESPFFRRKSDFEVYHMPMRPSTTQLLPERVVPTTRKLRMQPPSPVRQMGYSLNSLSFINSPVNSTHQPIFDHRPRPYSGISHHVEPQYLERSGISRSQQLQSHIHHLRQSSAAQSHKSFTRDDDLKLLSAIRGAKSGTTTNYFRSRPSTSTFAPLVIPFSKNRNEFPLPRAERSVRR
jgi:hypothetical protein